MITAILNTHKNGVVEDTIDSIFHNMTNKVVAIVDLAHKVKLNIPIIQGFYHNCHKSPYRNLVLGLKIAYESFPSEWYCYLEYDCLIASKAIVDDLGYATNQDLWMCGFDFKVHDIKLSFLEKIVKKSLGHARYLLGCCVFYRHEFIEKLYKEGFFDRFLLMTNNFSGGFFPEYNCYDFGEHLFPTLVNGMGGKIGNLKGKYLVRWQPEIEEGYEGMSILHPVKKNGKVREYFRLRRNLSLVG